MPSKKNLWGELPNPETIRTPYTLLKEQASILTEITNSLLIGEVIHNQKDKFFVIILRIKAPSLNNYTYSVLEAQYSIKLYPVFVKNLASDSFKKLENLEANKLRLGLMSAVEYPGWLENQGYRQCSSEEELEKTLGEILSSPEVRRVISALLAQIHADIPKP
jgi:hypothetical protein